MKTSIKILVGIVVLVVVIIFLQFSLTGNAVKEQETIKIGVMIPLTGNLGNFGQNWMTAIEIAVDEINNNGGINGKKVEMIYEDSKCDPKESVTIVTKLINIDKVPVIIGDVCSGSTLSAAPIAESNKVVLISPGASSPKITNAGDYIFRDYPSDSYQGKFSAELAYDRLGKRNAAVLSPINDYSLGVKDVFENRFIELGGNIVLEETYNEGTKDLRSQITKIKQTNPDVIFLTAYPDELVIAIKEINELGIKSQILGTETMDDPNIPNKVGDAAEGVIYSKPYSPLTDDFKKAMRENLGNDEIIAGAPNAYDAVKIIANILKKVGPDGEEIKNELYKVKNYQGISGKISFDDNGDLETTQFTVKQIKNKEAMELNL